MMNKRILFNTFAFAIFSALSIQMACAEDTANSQDEQRFATVKQAQQRNALYSYIRSAKGSIERDWHPTTASELQITKVKFTINSDGKVGACSAVVPSKSKEEDASILAHLKSCSFPPLKDSLSAVEMFLTFMSDGAMNMVEFTDSSDANEYYKDVLGGSINSSGMLIRSSRSIFPEPRATLIPSTRMEKKDANSSVRAAKPELDLSTYMADLQKRVRRGSFPGDNDSKRVVVQFKIQKSGEITDITLEHSSGLDIADQTALDSVKQSAPFLPVPADLAKGLEVQFIYDVHISARGRSCVLLHKL